MSLFSDMFRVPIRRESAVMGTVQLESNSPAAGGGLTIDKLRAAMKLVDRVAPEPRMIVSDQALKVVGRNFPSSRHRSRRIHKKLIKRYGGEFRYKPTSWQMSDTIIVHPAIMAELQAKFTADARGFHDRAFMSALYGVPVYRS